MGPQLACPLLRLSRRPMGSPSGPVSLQKYDPALTHEELDDDVTGAGVELEQLPTVAIALVGPFDTGSKLYLPDGPFIGLLGGGATIVAAGAWTDDQLGR